MRKSSYGDGKINYTGNKNIHGKYLDVFLVVFGVLFFGIITSNIRHLTRSSGVQAEHITFSKLFLVDGSSFITLLIFSFVIVAPYYLFSLLKEKNGMKNFPTFKFVFYSFLVFFLLFFSPIAAGNESFGYFLLYLSFYYIFYLVFLGFLPKLYNSLTNTESKKEIFHKIRKRTGIILLILMGVLFLYSLTCGFALNVIRGNLFSSNPITSTVRFWLSIPSFLYYNVCPNIPVLNIFVL